MPAEERPVPRARSIRRRGGGARAKKRMRDSARERPAGAGAQGRLGGARDRELRARPECRHAGQQREVAVDVDQPERAPADHRGVGEVEIDPPGAQHNHEAEARDDPGLEAELEPGNTRDDRPRPIRRGR